MLADQVDPTWGGNADGFRSHTFGDCAQIQRGYIEAIRDYWVARSDLERAVGGQLTLAAGTRPLDLSGSHEHDENSEHPHQHDR